MRRCPVCGYRNDKTIERCVKCGARVPNPTDNKRWVSTMLLIIAFMTFVAYVVTFMFPKTHMPAQPINSTTVVQYSAPMRSAYSVIKADIMHSLYRDIAADIDSNTVQILKRLYNDYGITLKFNKDDSGMPPDLQITPLSSSAYNDSIDLVYKAVKTFGIEPSTKNFFRVKINTIYVVDAILPLHDEVYSRYDYVSHTAVLAAGSMPNQDVNACIHALADCVGHACAANASMWEFSKHNFNGFINYDTMVDDEEQTYTWLLNLNGLYGQERQRALYTAGFLNEQSCEARTVDFNTYVQALFSKYSDENNIWALYNDYPIVRYKTNNALDYLIRINPEWDLKFILNMSHPQGSKAFQSINASNESMDYTNEDKQVYLKQYIVPDLIEEYTGVVQSDYGPLNVTIALFSPTGAYLTALCTLSPQQQGLLPVLIFNAKVTDFNALKKTISLTGTSWVSNNSPFDDVPTFNGNLYPRTLSGNFNIEGFKKCTLEKVETNE